MRRKAPTVFTRMLLSFLVILLIPISIGSYMYRHANRLVRQYSEDAARFMLEQSANTFENYLESVDKSIYNLQRDTDILSASYLNRPDFGTQQIQSFISLLKRIHLNTTNEPFTSNTILFLKTPDAIVRRESVSFGIEEFYDRFMEYDAFTYQQWQEAVLNSNRSRYFLPAQAITSKGSLYEKSHGEYVTYVHSNPAITAIVLLDASSARGLLREMILSEKGAAFIVDSSQQVILGTGDTHLVGQIDLTAPIEQTLYAVQRLDQTDMMVLRWISASSGLQYISVNPVQAAMKDVQYIQQLAILSILMIIGIGVLAACFFSRKHTSPLREITALLSMDNHKKKFGYEYRYIKERVAGLVSTNQELSKKVEKHQTISRNLFSGQLLGGTLKGQQELEALLDYFQIMLDGSYYCVLLLTYDQADSLLESNIIMLAMEEALTQERYSQYIHTVDNETFAVILGLPHSDKKRNRKLVEKYVQQVTSEMMEQHDMDLKIGIGNQHRQLIDVNFSFEEARISLERLKDNALITDVVWYEDIDSIEKCRYYYPLDLEQKLSGLVKMGKKNEVMRTLHQLYKENFTNRCLPRESQLQLFYEMKSTILKTLDDLKLSVDVGALQNVDFAAMHQLSSIDLFTRTYLAVCDTVQDGKKSHNQKLIQQILEELSTRYGDSGLCVNMLADRFGISTSYFPSFFKEQTGESFSVYLENIRIKAACTLLRETTESVEKVAQAVGYNSPYSFRRAFKKVIGEVPSKYREHIVGEVQVDVSSSKGQ